MVKLRVKKNIFYNNQITEKNLDINQSFQPKYLDKKRTVDMNKLLNRVKEDQQTEKKKKFIFFGMGVFLMSFMSIFVAIVK